MKLLIRSTLLPLLLLLTACGSQGPTMRTSPKVGLVVPQGLANPALSPDMWESILIPLAWPTVTAGGESITTPAVTIHHFDPKKEPLPNLKVSTGRENPRPGAADISLLGIRETITRNVSKIIIPNHFYKDAPLWATAEELPDAIRARFPEAIHLNVPVDIERVELARIRDSALAVNASAHLIFILGEPLIDEWDHFSPPAITASGLIVYEPLKPAEYGSNEEELQLSLHTRLGDPFAFLAAGRHCLEENDPTTAQRYLQSAVHYAMLSDQANAMRALLDAIPTRLWRKFNKHHGGVRHSLYRALDLNNPEAARFITNAPITSRKETFVNLIKGGNTYTLIADLCTLRLVDLPNGAARLYVTVQGRLYKITLNENSSEDIILGDGMYMRLSYRPSEALTVAPIFFRKIYADVASINQYAK